MEQQFWATLSQLEPRHTDSPSLADPPVTVTAVDSAQLAAVAAPVSIAAGAPALGELSSGQVPPPAGSASEVVSSLPLFPRSCLFWPDTTVSHCLGKMCAGFLFFLPR